MGGGGKGSGAEEEQPENGPLEFKRYSRWRWGKVATNSDGLQRSTITGPWHPERQRGGGGDFKILPPIFSENSRWPLE